ncbi:glycosyltransferase family 4 protein [Candidatus Neomarinimicrobiota bacterium]
MKIKLLYFDLYLPYLLNGDKVTIGGTAVEWKNWFHGFLNIGVDIELLTWEGAEKYIKKTHNINIRESYSLNKGIRFLRVLYYRLPALIKSIKNSQATHVIQQNGSWIAGLLAIITKLQRKSFILRIANDPDVNMWPSSAFSLRKKIGYWMAIKLSDFIFCQNNNQYDVLSKNYPRKNIHILYNPIIIAKKDKGNFNNRSYVAWIGRFAPQKNLPALLKIAESLPNIEFKIVGQKTNSTRQIDLVAIKKLKYLKNVELIDFIDRDNILEFLNHSKLLLNTSNHEGLSNTFLEALLVGTPIVTTSKVNPDNMIIEHKLGYVSDNHEEILENINHINNDFDYEVFYDRSYLFVKQNFDSTNQATQFIDYLQY